MMTPDQWRQLAAFAGVTHSHSRHMAGIWIEDAEYNDDIGRRWCPDTDWRDFGPLWVKLERWHQTTAYQGVIGVAVRQFAQAIHRGTEQDLMQAGCLLGAAIGSTMTAAPTAQEPK